MVKRLFLKKRWLSLLLLNSFYGTCRFAANLVSINFEYEDEMKVNDSSAVWTSFDSESHRKVYYCAQLDRTPITITQSVGIREKAVVGGNIDLWQEAGSLQQKTMSAILLQMANTSLGSMYRQGS